MPLLYLDSETTGLDPFTCELVTLQLRSPSGRSLIVKDPETLESIKPRLENNTIVGHNLKFDSKFLKYRYGITLRNVYDTYIAEIAISGGLLAGRKGASLKDLVYKYCGVILDKTEQCSFERGKKLTKEQEKYALDDTKYLPMIMQQQQAKIRMLGLEKVIDTEMKAIPAVVWLELSGINIDAEKVTQIKSKLEEQRNKAAETLRKEFQPYIVNLNSTKQLKEALNRAGISVEGTSVEELSKFNGPIIDALKDYKEAEKLLNTYAEKIPSHINPITHRVHSNFNQYGAKSGRFTSSNPNLQQQPSKFKEWRSIYKAQQGNKIIAADYSQIELRILGQVAHDKAFIKAYTDGVDLHRLTASRVYSIPLEKVTDSQRALSKSVNFGIAYGMWKNGLITSIRAKSGVTIGTDEAEQLINGFYKAYPAVSKYLWNVSEEGLKKREIRNKAGRLMRFEPPKDKREEGSIKRESKNLPIQSLCADMIKVAMGNIFLKLEPKGVKFINTIHDELVFEVPESIAEEAATIVKEEMEKAGKMYLKDMPCIAETKISNCWEK